VTSTTGEDQQTTEVDTDGPQGLVSATAGDDVSIEHGDIEQPASRVDTPEEVL